MYLTFVWMAMSITNQEIRNIDTNNNNNNNNILINEEKESETEKVTEEAEKEGENSEKLHLLDEKQFLKFAPLLENKNNLEFLEKIRKIPLLYGKRFYPITEIELKYIKSYISKTLSNPMDEASTSAQTHATHLYQSFRMAQTFCKVAFFISLYFAGAFAEISHNPTQVKHRVPRWAVTDDSPIFQWPTWIKDLLSLYSLVVFAQFLHHSMQIGIYF